MMPEARRILSVRHGKERKKERAEPLEPPVRRRERAPERRESPAPAPRRKREKTPA